MIITRGILQHDQSDCGAAALASVFNMHRLLIPVTQLREAMRVDKSGASIYAIIKTAETYGIRGEGVVGDLEELAASIGSKTISLPAILHVEIKPQVGHFLVLINLTSQYAKVFDPAFGIKKLKITELNKLWTGNLIHFNSSDFKKSSGSVSKATIRKMKANNFMFSLFRHEKKSLVWITILSVATLIMSFLGSYLYKVIVDAIIQSTSKGNLVASIFILLAVLYAVQMTFSIIQGSAISRLSFRMSRSGTMAFYNKLSSLPNDFFNRFDSGNLISRFQSVPDLLDKVVIMVLDLCLLLSSIIGSSIILILISPVLYGLTILIMLVYGCLVLSFIKPMSEKNKAIQVNQAKTITLLRESVDGISTIKLSSSQSWFKSKLATVIDRLCLDISKLIQLSVTSESIVGFIESLGMMGIFCIGSIFVTKKQITLGELIVFNSLMIYFFSPAKKLMMMQKDVQDAKVLYDRIKDVMYATTELERVSRFISPSAGIRNDYLALNGVSFSYNLDQVILNQIDITIEQYAKVGIIGKSGSGKTTVIKLLATLLFPDKGVMSYRGQLINKENLITYRQKMTYVDQESFAFEGNLYDNIVMGMTNIDEDWLGTLCQVFDIFDMSNQGLTLYILENGKNLSGGQKQKLGLVRALLAKPEILILDEATSKIDKASEEKIIDFITTIEKMTVISVFHNLDLLDKYETILNVAQNGIYEPLKRN
ncbi:peptidase domain-containing ABC transporter [Lactococcus carnosus]|uniref:peptidase domain-containing ABC transporter n=1 Tax=Pseudolactococcus carnosus TaxID=2749961 RepID=UPI001C4F89AE|nr:ABC transporter transmembrane domain-containing protein [Lactococcus carnosus]MCJ1970401.1 ATP-binding cassette domain-containing protein [Lactococcus carnosus]